MVTDEILVKYIVGEAEAHEVAMVEQWRKLDVANEKHLQQFKTLWTESAGIPHQDKVNVDKAWEQVQKTIHTKIERKGRVLPIGRAWLMAASFALLLGIGFFLFNRTTPKATEMLTAIATDSVQNLTLADGSNIMIREGSIAYPKTFDGEKRAIKMNGGKAFFKIAPNKAKPFEIASENTTITVVGTEFEITANTAFTQVLVREGKVKFNTPKGALFLTAGMGAKYNRKTQLLEKLMPPSNNTFGYVTGALKFENKMLKEVVNDLNQYYQGYTIELENKALENCRITSSFNHDKLETVLDVLSLTLNLEIERSADKKFILIKGKGCTP